jgi:predicted regulator of Ras-like GTPase activity (Roadblock/LC7/MglB family)
MRGPLFSIIAFFVFEGLLYAALKFLPAYMHMDTLRELPLAGVYAMIVIIPIVVTVLVFRNRSNADKVKIAFTMMGFASLLGVTGNFISQQTRHLTDVVLIFNWIEGVIMVLGGIVCGVLAYFKLPARDSALADGLHRMDSSNATRRKAGDELKAEAIVAPTQSLVETDEKAPAISPTSTSASRGLKVPLGTGNKMPAMTGQDLKPKNAMSNSASNLRGLLDTLAPDEDAKPQPKSEIKGEPKLEVKSEVKPEVKPEIKTGAASAEEIAAKADAIAKKALEASAAASAKAAEKPAAPGNEPDSRKPSSSATGIPEQRRPTASSTATRLQAQKRKSTSTFIKLQALSSSGTGATRPKTADAPGSEASESLKSILDRLDSSDDEDIDFFGSDSLLEKPDVSDRPGRVSKTSIPAASPPVSSSAIPAQPTRPLSTKPGTGTSNTSMPAATPSNTVAPATPASSAKPATRPLSTKESDPSIASLNKEASSGPQTPATPIPAPAVEAKTPAPDPGVQPSLTDMLNSIKTPGTEPSTSAAKPERPAGGLGGGGLGGTGLGGTTLGRAAGKKTGIQLGGTSSTNLNRMEAPTPEPVLDAKPIPAAEPKVPEPAAAVFEEPAAVTPEPIVETAIEVVPEVVPAIEPIVEPVMEPTPDPVVESVVEPLAETSIEPIIESAPETIAEPTVEAVLAPEVEPIVESVAETMVGPADEALSADDYADAVSEAIASASGKIVSPKASASAKTSVSVEETFTPDSQSTSSDFTSFKPSFDTQSFESYESSAEDTPMNFAADLEEPAEQPANTLFESAAVDKEIEDIFSNLVPPEAQQEVNAATLSHSRLPAIDKLQAQSLLATDESSAQTKSSPKAEAKPEVKTEAAIELELTPPAVQEEAAATPTEPEKAEAAESNTLFETEAVDREIEDIFSNLVPPEAQQEVNESTLSHNRLQAMDRSEAQALLGRSDEGSEAVIVTSMNSAAKKAEEAKIAEEEKVTAAAKAPEPVSAKEAEPAEAKESADGKKKEGLFDPSLDKEIDDIFLNLAPEEAQAEVNDETLAKVKSADLASEEMSFEPPADAELTKSEPAKVEPTATPAAAAETKTEVKTEVKTEAKAKSEESFAPPAQPEEKVSTADKVADLLDSLSDKTAADAETINKSAEVDLASAESALEKVTSFVAEHTAAEAAVKAVEESTTSSAPVSEAAPAQTEAAAAKTSDAQATPAANKPKEVKEFGRLSVKSATAGAANETVGTMKTIGKLLIDVPAIENIIKTGETGTIGKNLATARVISSQRGESINALLEKIDAFPGIAGTLIVGHDGLVISSTLKGGKDKDTIGALSVACLGSTNLGTRKLEIGKLKQMVFITDSTITVLTDVEVGILAVLLDSLEINKIDGVLQTIHDTIHG